MIQLLVLGSKRVGCAKYNAAVVVWVVRIGVGGE